MVCSKHCSSFRTETTKDTYGSLGLYVEPPHSVLSSNLGLGGSRNDRLLLCGTFSWLVKMSENFLCKLRNAILWMVVVLDYPTDLFGDSYSTGLVREAVDVVIAG
jgi:hypothetical protein